MIGNITLLPLTSRTAVCGLLLSDDLIIKKMERERSEQVE